MYCVKVSARTLAHSNPADPPFPLIHGSTRENPPGVSQHPGTGGEGVHKTFMLQWQQKILQADYYRGDLAIKYST